MIVSLDSEVKLRMDLTEIFTSNPLKNALSPSNDSLKPSHCLIDFRNHLDMY